MRKIIEVLGIAAVVFAFGAHGAQSAPTPKPVDPTIWSMQGAGNQADNFVSGYGAVLPSGWAWSSDNETAALPLFGTALGGVLLLRARRKRTMVSALDI